ncbi:MAG: DM13 domain-containing protein [Actinomycetota bacterium]|nr:DM13 domain-containing protein [Actinomycetota bacterium]
MTTVTSFIRRHRLASGVTGLLGIGLAVFVFVWFQPQKLVINKTVNEAAPKPATSTQTVGSKAGLVASGSFRSLEHRTTGKASLLRLADDSFIVRFDDLDTSNGPKLRVYLSELPPNLGWRDYGKRFLDLGALKGNRGDQNYTVRRGVDVSKFHSVVIWCERFTVGFGVAPLA